MDLRSDPRWAAVESWPLAVVAMDLDGRISYANPAAEALYGYTQDTILGRPIIDVLVLPDDQQPAVDIVATVLAGQVWDGEFDVPRADGSALRVHVTDFPWWDGDRVVGIVGISRRLDPDAEVTSSRGLEELARVAYELAAADDIEQVADAVTVHAATAVGARVASLSLVGEDGMLGLVGLTGGREQSRSRFNRFPADTSTPVGEAVLTSSVVTVIGSAEVQRRYPGVFAPEEQKAVMALPLLVQGRCLGVVGLAWGWLVELERDDLAFLHILVDTCAQAVDRLAKTASLRTELERVGERAAAWERLQLLQKVTGDLTGAESVQEIALTVVDNAAAHLGADTVRVYVGDDDGVFRSVAWHGMEGAAAELYHEFTLDEELPGAAVARTGEPLVCRDLAEIVERFPALDGYYSSDRSLHIHPVRLGEKTLGVLGMTFSHPGDTDVQSAFVQSLADALAQAIERAQANERVRAATERLAVLADASLALSASLDYQSTVDAVTQLLVPRLADWAVVQVLRDGTLETVSVHHPDPAKVRWLRSLEGRWPVDMQASTGSPAVVRTGVSELYPTLPAELVEQAATDDEHLAALRALGMASVLVVPLPGRSSTIGVVTLIYAESGRHYTRDDIPFVENIARRAGLALDTADTFRTQSGRLATVAEVADAAQRAILVEPPSRIGPFSVAARYRSAHAEARVGGDLYEVVPYGGGVRLLIGDVKGKGLAAVRTATVVLGAFRTAAEDVPDLASVVERMDAGVRRHLGDEDFVTACLVDLQQDGTLSLLSAGHPPPWVVDEHGARELAVTAAPPLGLSGSAAATAARLRPGDRLVLFTDGLTEARDGDGAFADPATVLAPLQARGAGLDRALDDVLIALEAHTGGRLTDDLALLVVELSA